MKIYIFKKILFLMLSYSGLKVKDSDMSKKGTGEDSLSYFDLEA